MTRPNDLQPSSQAPPIAPFLVAWCICLAVMETSGVIFARSRAPLDFQQMYTSGYQLRTDPSKLYDLVQQAHVQHLVTSIKGFLPFYHPIYETVVFLPFSMLGYQSAYLSFIVFNMILLMASYFIVRPSLSSAAPEWLPNVLPFLFFPLLLAVALGQDSILSLLLCCLSWRQLRSGKDASAGCFLALALFKFQIVIPIAILIAIRSGWRFVAGFIVTAAGVVLLCLSIGRWAGMVAYLRVLHWAAPTATHTSLAQQNVAEHPLAMPNLAGLLYACGGRFLTHSGYNLLIGVCSLGVFLWCASAVRHREEKSAFSIAILCGLLVSYHSYLYELTLALLPVALLAGRTHRYIVVAMLPLAILLFYFGLNSYFLMAIPILAILVNAILSTRGSSEPISV